MLAEYAIGEGYETVYTLGSNEIPYTRDLPVFFADAFENGGGSVVGSDQYKIGAGDYSAVVTKLANVDPAPDAVFTPMFIPDSVVFLRQLRQAGISIPVLSTDGNADAALLDAGAKAIDGLTFSNSVCTAEGDPDVQSFYDDYNARYGEDPELLRRGDRLRRDPDRRRRDRACGQRRARGDRRAARHHGLHRHLGAGRHRPGDQTSREAGRPHPDGRHRVHLPRTTGARTTCRRSIPACATTRRNSAGPARRAG